jgi:hypothetical protein
MLLLDGGDDRGHAIVIVIASTFWRGHYRSLWIKKISTKIFWIRTPKDTKTFLDPKDTKTFWIHDQDQEDTKTSQIKKIKPFVRTLNPKIRN